MIKTPSTAAKDGKLMGPEQKDQNSQQNEGKNPGAGKIEEFKFFVIRDDRSGDENNNHFKNDSMKATGKEDLPEI